MPTLCLFLLSLVATTGAVIISPKVSTKSAELAHSTTYASLLAYPGTKVLKVATSSAAMDKKRREQVKLLKRMADNAQGKGMAQRDYSVTEWCHTWSLKPTYAGASTYASCYAQQQRSGLLP